jgi:hypothetical protein
MKLKIKINEVIELKRMAYGKVFILKNLPLNG